MIFKLFRNHAEFVLFFKYSNIIFICYTMMCWCIIIYASNKTCIEEQTTQWPKEKVQKDKQRSIKHIKTKNKVTRTLLKTGGELMCCGRVSSS
jgi:hypothetical protein